MSTLTATRPPGAPGRSRPKFPFGSPGPFNGMNFGAGEDKFEYTPNAKQWQMHNCCATEVFYGGAVFGGKSHALLMHNAAHCIEYGKPANTICFRRTYDDLEGSLIKEQVEMFDGWAGDYNATKHVFKWKTGATTWFRHLEKESDVEKHQSRQYTLICFDELTQFFESQYIFMFLRLRSPKEGGVLSQMLSASNPRGIGHKWVSDRFIVKKKPNHIYAYEDPEFEGHVFTRVFIPAYATDNVDGMRNDPGYLARMKMTQSEDAFNALVRGDWTFFEGMAFPEWDPALHVVKARPIPPGWKVIRTLDWGYSAPFSVCWLAQEPVSKSIVLFAEWYGARPRSGGGVEGMRMSVDDLRQGILDRERAMVASGMCLRPWYGVADPSIWSKTSDEPSIADRLNVGGVLFRAGKRERVVGKTFFHGALQINPVTGRPGFRVMDRCGSFISLFPGLVMDERNMEDVDTRQEDHSYDAARYGVVELLTTAPVPASSLVSSKAFNRPVMV